MRCARARLPLLLALLAAAAVVAGDPAPSGAAPVVGDGAASAPGEPVCGAGLPPGAGAVSFAGLVPYFLARMLSLAAPPPPGDRLLVIDIAERHVTLYVDGRPVRRYPVAVGTPEDPSPVGEFRVVHKDRDWGGGFGARWIGLDVPWGIYGLHGTNKPYTVGTRASHGCFRMYNRDVIALFPEVPIGTPVHIVGPEPAYWPRALYRPGASGRDVVVLQFRLRQAGFPVRQAGGRYDESTQAAVRAAQSFFGLAATGEAAADLQWLLGFRHEGEAGSR
ncbi:MAG: L,D-transpeptidase family protein [Clostridia bacterium]|nr:L,D-transpeptidase family protein [Clostridia bacterium]